MRDCDRRDISAAFRALKAYFTRLTPDQIDTFNALPYEVRRAIIKREIQIGVG